MVQSRIDPSIVYQEDRTIDPEDENEEKEVPVYETTFLGHSVTMSLGNVKLTYMNKGVVYVPIYLVEDDAIGDKIGVYEMRASKAPELLDDDGDIRIDLLGDELLFSFTPDVLQALTDTHTGLVLAQEAIDQDANDQDIIDQDAIDQDIIDQDVIDLTATPPSVTQHLTLPHETQAEADGLVEAYRAAKEHSWVQRYMKNPHYAIHEVESNGDCFFAVVRDAFAQGHTVASLRGLVSAAATEQHYQYYKTIQELMTAEMKRCDDHLLEIKRRVEKDLKSQIKKAADPGTLKTLKEEVRLLEEEHKRVVKEKHELRDTWQSYLGTDIGDGLASMDHFRQHILKSSFWADEFTIASLERQLNVKIIVLSESAYQDKAMHQVVDCGFQDQASPVTFTPEHYIIAAFGGNHYRLVSYKGKKLLRFNELPYHLTQMIVMKCMENNSGTFATIGDFQALVEPSLAPTNTVSKTLDIDYGTVFMFYVKSEAKAKPGKGSGETIPIARIPEFHALAKMPQWRRKLDDAWVDTHVPIVIDELPYASVAHYMEAAKYRKQHPTLSRQFSLVSQSPYSKDVKLCQQAAVDGIDGEPPVTVDPDFEERREMEQKTALLHKFSIDGELRQILLGTKNALLTHFVPRRPAAPAVALMEVRQVLNVEAPV